MPSAPQRACKPEFGSLFASARSRRHRAVTGCAGLTHGVESHCSARGVADNPHSIAVSQWVISASLFPTKSGPPSVDRLQNLKSNSVT